MDGYRVQINCVQCGETTSYILEESAFIENYCENCQARLSLVSEKVSGFVYILVNHDMPDLIKIGFTDRDPFTRCREISRFTGVPSDFEVFCYYAKNGALAFESDIHNYLDPYRLPAKEFFRLPPESAIDLVRQEFAVMPDYKKSNLHQAKGYTGDLSSKSGLDQPEAFNNKRTGVDNGVFRPKVNEPSLKLDRVKCHPPIPKGYEARMRCQHCTKMNLIKNYDCSVLLPKCGSCGKRLSR